MWSSELEVGWGGWQWKLWPVILTWFSAKERPLIGVNQWHVLWLTVSQSEITWEDAWQSAATLSMKLVGNAIPGTTNSAKVLRVIKIFLFASCRRWVEVSVWTWWQEFGPVHLRLDDGYGLIPAGCCAWTAKAAYTCNRVHPVMFWLLWAFGELSSNLNDYGQVNWEAEVTVSCGDWYMLIFGTWRGVGSYCRRTGKTFCPVWRVCFFFVLVSWRNLAFWSWLSILRKLRCSLVGACGFNTWLTPYHILR